MKEIRKLIDEAAARLNITTETVMRNIRDISYTSNSDDVRLNASVKLGKYIGMENADAEDRTNRGGFNGFVEVYERPKEQLLESHKEQLEAKTKVEDEMPNEQGGSVLTRQQISRPRTRDSV